LISLDDLDYELPPGRIAQEPVHPRDAARLLVVDRARGELFEHRFSDLAQLSGPEDLFVVNDTRVIPARIRGTKDTGGRVEALLTEPIGEDGWRALLGMRGRARPGQRLHFGGNRGWSAKIESIRDDGQVVLRFRADDTSGAASAASVPEEIGEIPLPPYIERTEPRAQDREDYQSVFARWPGSVAAPTASRHFTLDLAEKLRIAKVTLQVGPGTFRPIRTQRLDEHRMDEERFEISHETAQSMAATRARGGRVIAVGTTVVRALETTGGAAGQGRTGLYIQPGHHFQAIDSLITCFHLPRSSLLALVMAFVGVELTRRAYRHALDGGFRFYSYGDAMWIR
jgi:S-adenosylmethionine:tRNA ribosyltransferase-isomerase